LVDVGRPVNLVCVAIANHGKTVAVRSGEGISIVEVSNDELGALDVGISSGNNCGFIIRIILASDTSVLNAGRGGWIIVVDLASQSNVVSSDISSSGESAIDIRVGAIIILIDINAEIGRIASPC